MSSLIFDLLIWALLLLGTGFGILAFAGLLIFPDIRSRMYTASRASLISASAIIVAVIIFGISGFLGGGGALYGILVIHTIFLWGILVIAAICISKLILARTGNPSACLTDRTGNEPGIEKKD
jgi:multisubunit Na+/H+ antiporter MnhG subunit